jgi:hypothetical protein
MITMDSSTQPLDGHDPCPAEPIGVAYLVRGRDANWEASCRRFVHSYLDHVAGCQHQLSVITKGFPSMRDLQTARDILRPLQAHEVEVEDDSFDIGAYRDWARQTAATNILLLNTGSEILCSRWLAKFAATLVQPGVGLAGATASYESLSHMSRDFPRFPNPHIRTTAILLRRELFLECAADRRFDTKEDAFRFESGCTGLTRFMAERGLETLVVGRDGRGYGPNTWPRSGTFRQGVQSNLLIGDRVTRLFDAATWDERFFLVSRTWGSFAGRGRL